MDGEDWVMLAEIVGPRGNRGEVSAISHTNQPDRFATLTEATLVKDGQPPRTVTIEDCWEHKDRLILKFGGTDSISDAEQWRGWRLCVPFEQRAPLPEGEFYLSDLVGCVVVDHASGRDVGTVVGWHEYGGPLLLEVRGEGNEEILVPFAAELRKNVDLAGRKLEIAIPEGLLDLNRP